MTGIGTAILDECLKVVETASEVPFLGEAGCEQKYRRSMVRVVEGLNLLRLKRHTAFLI